MKKRILSVTGLLAVSMIAGTVTINAQSQKKTKVAVNIPSAGIAVALDNYDIQDEAKKAELTSLMNQKVATPNQEEDKKDAADNTDKNKENETDKETEKKAEEEKAEQPKTVYDTMAMSQVEDYVNVRALPSTDADIVGKIYNNCAAKIVGVEGEWYKIESGNVTGYIYSKYFVTGEEAKAVAKYIRIAPRKVRVVMNLIRGKNVADAFAILKFTPKAGADVIEKVLKSAVANAENNFDMNVDKLYISSAYVDQGPTLKRIHPRSRGQAFSILKRTSHVTVVVAER